MRADSVCVGALSIEARATSEFDRTMGWHWRTFCRLIRIHCRSAIGVLRALCLVSGTNGGLARIHGGAASSVRGYRADGLLGRTLGLLHGEYGGAAFTGDQRTLGLLLWTLRVGGGALCLHSRALGLPSRTLGRSFWIHGRSAISIRRYGAFGLHAWALGLTWRALGGNSDAHGDSARGSGVSWALGLDLWAGGLLFRTVRCFSRTLGGGLRLVGGTASNRTDGANGLFLDRAMGCLLRTLGRLDGAHRGAGRAASASRWIGRDGTACGVARAFGGGSTRALSHNFWTRSGFVGRAFGGCCRA